MCWREQAQLKGGQWQFEWLDYSYSGMRNPLTGSFAYSRDQESQISHVTFPKIYIMLVAHPNHTLPHLNEYSHQFIKLICPRHADFFMNNSSSTGNHVLMLWGFQPPHVSSSPRSWWPLPLAVTCHCLCSDDPLSSGRSIWHVTIHMMEASQDAS